jgi:SAM-dependent methyltransferase
MDKAKNYWQKATKSHHRFATEQFYKEKAEENAALMNHEDRNSSCVDLGCGAGELLYYLSFLLNVQVGIDYSDSMLKAARHRLVDKNISLINQDLFVYLKTADHKVWITTSAINQYFDATDQKRLLDIFIKNQSATAFYLFDCVDPLRYAILNFGISYLPKAPESKIKAIAKYCYYTFKGAWLLCRWALKSGSGAYCLGPSRMGWGYFPRFWLKEGALRNMNVKIVSSHAYEYRYHVLLHKSEQK